MTCKLDKFKTYDVGQVHHNLSTGAYSVQVLNGGPTCPDGVFNSKKAELVVSAGTNPSLGYNVNTNKPVITVPSQAFVIDYGSSFGFLDFLLLVGGVGLAFVIGRAVYRRLTAATTEYNAEPTPAYSGGHSTYPASHATPSRGYGYSGPSSSPAPTAAAASGGTTVIHTGPDLLTTVLLAEALSGNNHSSSGGGNTTINNTTVNNNGDSYSSDDSDSSDSRSSGSSSFESDSSDDSSYSSDSSSSDDSYSSDSSSDSSFSSDSSDSGSSFGSDD